MVVVVVGVVVVAVVVVVVVVVGVHFNYSKFASSLRRLRTYTRKQQIVDL